jgi:hypothetical protein
VWLTLMLLICESQVGRKYSPPQYLPLLVSLEVVIYMINPAPGEFVRRREGGVFVVVVVIPEVPSRPATIFLQKRPSTVPTHIQ